MVQFLRILVQKGMKHASLPSMRTRGLLAKITISATITAGVLLMAGCGSSSASHAPAPSPTAGSGPAQVLTTWVHEVAQGNVDACNLMTTQAREVGASQGYDCQQTVMKFSQLLSVQDKAAASALSIVSAATAPDPDTRCFEPAAFSDPATATTVFGNDGFGDNNFDNEASAGLVRQSGTWLVANFDCG